MNANTGSSSSSSTTETSSKTTDLFAAYDETLLRFTGPVRGSKADAQDDAKRAPKGHKVVVRKVGETTEDD